MDDVVCDDGIRLHLEGDRVEGGDLTLVFVHGIASSLQEFREQRTALQGHLNTVFYDHRGHGASDCGETRAVTVPRLAQDLNLVIDHATAHNEPVVLVTHSLGGMIALAFMGRRPELVGTRIVGVALISTTAARIPEVATPHLMAAALVRTHLAHAMLRLVTLCSPLLDALKPFESVPGRWWLRHMMFGRSTPPNHLLNAKQALWSHIPTAVIASAIRSLLTFDRTTSFDVLRQIPVLVVSGGTDRTIPARRSRRLAARIGPTAQLVIVPGAGHSVNQTHADTVNDALQQLLTRVTR